MIVQTSGLYIYIYIYIYTYISYHIHTNAYIHKYLFGGARSVMVTAYKMHMVTQVQISGEAVSISHSSNTLGKGMNPIILPPAMGK